MSIRFIQDAKSGLITVISDATVMVSYGNHSEVFASELVEMAAALGVPFLIRA